jgi:acetyl-CoA C-acetyltransferase
MPVRQYAVIENALRFAESQSLSQHRDEVAGQWSEMSRVAAGNPDAWSREVVGAERIRDAGASNRMLAFPYTKLHNSQWNVDQAAGLIFTSAAVARAECVPESQWIHPRAVVESNYMLPLVHRAELHRCAAFGIAGRRACELASLLVAEIAHLELYSCFPVAVRVQQRELGIPRDRPVTVTGGMAFAGGPLNNFVLQAAVRLAQCLRRERDAERGERHAHETGSESLVVASGLRLRIARRERRGGAGDGARGGRGGLLGHRTRGGLHGALRGRSAVADGGALRYG